MMALAGWRPYTSVRYFGVVFPGGIDVANQFEPMNETVEILGQHVVPGCLAAWLHASETYDATLRRGLFVQPSAFASWFIELEPR